MFTELVVVVYSGVKGVLACRNILVVDGVAFLVLGKLLLGVGIRKACAHAVAPFGLCANLASTHAVVVKVSIGQIGQLVRGRLEVGCRGGKFVLHLIIIYRCREVVVALGVFGREVEIMAHFRLKVGVALNYPYA